jgi:hypothetical protein
MEQSNAWTGYLSRCTLLSSIPGRSVPSHLLHEGYSDGK